MTEPTANPADRILTLAACMSAYTNTRPRLTKAIDRRKDPPEIIAFGHAYLHDALEMDCQDLDALERVLKNLSGLQYACAVRGALVTGDWKAGGIRRLSEPDPVHGDPATIMDVRKRWIAIDVDTVPADAVRDHNDPSEIVDYVTCQLPKCFVGVSCVLQFTSSHGFKPGPRVRLWFLIDEPILTLSTRGWLAPYTIADAQLFLCSQPIYTAAPKFIDEMPDHVAERVIRVDLSSERVALPADILEIDAQATDAISLWAARRRPKKGAGGLSASADLLSRKRSQRGSERPECPFADYADSVPGFLNMSTAEQLAETIRSGVEGTFNSNVKRLAGLLVLSDDFDRDKAITLVEDALVHGMRADGRSEREITRRRKQVPRIVDYASTREAAKYQPREIEPASSDTETPSAEPDGDFESLEDAVARIKL